MRWAGIAAAIIAASVDGLYLGVVGSQGASDPEFIRLPFVASFIALMAICAALSARASAARWRSLLLGISTGGLLLLGYFGMFSIGLPLLVAGLIAGYGTIRTLTHGSLGGTSGGAAVGMAAGGAMAAIVILLIGFLLADLAIRCPSDGTVGGSGTTLLGGSYSYSCDNGKLTISR